MDEEGEEQAGDAAAEVDELARVLGLRVAEAPPELGGDQEREEDPGEDRRAAQVLRRDAGNQTASSSTKVL
jgi:hypothetical protein